MSANTTVNTLIRLPPNLVWHSSIQALHECTRIHNKMAAIRRTRIDKKNYYLPKPSQFIQTTTLTQGVNVNKLKMATTFDNHKIKKATCLFVLFFIKVTDIKMERETGIVNKIKTHSLLINLGNKMLLWILTGGTVTVSEKVRDFNDSDLLEHSRP